jgi:C4-dicarboxylate transporter, DctM subunit
MRASGAQAARRPICSAPAVLALLPMASIHGVWRASDLAPILTATLRESTMLMLIIGMSLLCS